METIVCARCGDKIPKNYSKAEVDSTHYWWRCSHCGQEYVEARNPIISLTVKSELPKDVKVEVMDNLGNVTEIIEVKDDEMLPL